MTSILITDDTYVQLLGYFENYQSCMLPFTHGLCGYTFGLTNRVVSKSKLLLVAILK